MFIWGFHILRCWWIRYTIHIFPSLTPKKRVLINSIIQLSIIIKPNVKCLHLSIDSLYYLLTYWVSITYSPKFFYISPCFICFLCTSYGYKRGTLNALTRGKRGNGGRKPTEKTRNAGRRTATGRGTGRGQTCPAQPKQKAKKNGATARKQQPPHQKKSILKTRAECVRRSIILNL